VQSSSQATVGADISRYANLMGYGIQPDFIAFMSSTSLRYPVQFGRILFSMLRMRRNRPSALPKPSNPLEEKLYFSPWTRSRISSTLSLRQILMFVEFEHVLNFGS
jgi:hypothetical protein